jgi:hypothetical protein
MGRSSPSPTRLSSPNVFRIDVSGGRFAAFRASIGAGRVDADNGRQVDHPPTTRCPNWHTSDLIKSSLVTRRAQVRLEHLEKGRTDLKLARYRKFELLLRGAFRGEPAGSVRFGETLSLVHRAG